jgi:hypothetical protein
MGMFTGSRCHKSSIHDVRLLAMPKIGIYPEHCTSDSDFFDIEIECEENGVNMEWWYGLKDNGIPEHIAWATQQLGANIANGRAGSWGNNFYNMKVKARNGAGFYLDAGSFGNKIGIDGYIDLTGSKYGLVLPNVLADPSRPNLYDLKNINFGSIPTEYRVTRHSNPMGVV